MKNKVVPLRVSENLTELVALCGQDQRTDKATVLRQWLYEGAQDYALKLVDEGRLTASRASEFLEMSMYDLYRSAESRGLRLGATEEQYLKSLEQVRRQAADRVR